jgi:2-oxoglutarate ferredoxin oxidoreductase subunit alpha
VTTFQAEDEIAGIGIRPRRLLRRRDLGVTTTSGPGIALKSETIGLAVSLELPLVIVDVQRGGPSTGLPTKTEQSDLLQAMFGRNGESPVPIVAPQTPATASTPRSRRPDRDDLPHPGLLLSDGYLANGSEPWRMPEVAARCPTIDPSFATEPNATDDGATRVPPLPARRGHARPPVGDPRHAGLEHRIGGIEKADGTGNISYDPDNHDRMVRTRQAKVDGIAETPRARGRRPDRRRRPSSCSGGARPTARSVPWRPARAQGRGSVAQRTCATSTRSRPTPARCCAATSGDRPEMNLGQLAMLLRAKYLVDAGRHTQVRGLPFRIADLVEVIT